MTTRLTGLASGLDTESIITEMISGYKTKVDNAKNEQKKLQWKKEAWSSLNTKLYNFYNNALSTFQQKGSYKAKKVETTDSDNKVTVSSGNTATTGVHTLSIKQVASSGYLTSGSLKGNTYNTTSYKAAESADVSLSDIKDSKGYERSIEGKSFDVSYTTVDADGNETTQSATITATAGEDGTLQSVIDNMNTQLADQGIDMTVSYNAEKGALQFTNNTATEVTGEDGTKTYEGGIDYTVKAVDADSASALGISAKGSTVSKQTKESGDNVSNMSSAFYVKSTSEKAATVTGNTKLTDMGISSGTTYTIKVGTGDSAKEYNYTIDQTTTLSGLAAEFSKMGVTASYDAKQGRFFVNSVDSGEANNFTLTADNDEGLRAIGLDAAHSTKLEAQDAIIEYNGATFQQASNNFELNGLSFTVNDVTTSTDSEGNVKDNPIRMTVSTDTDTIYNNVKNFIKEYNSLIDEMNTLYDADDARDYDMLTDDDEESMSDDDITEWNDKIKASLLRRDTTISSLLSTMRSSLNGSVSYTNSSGVTKKYSLSSFGITTGSYSENGKLHIYGDSDDSSYSSYDNKLKEAIADDPDALIETLSTLGKNLYTKMQKAMKSSSSSSALTFYNDKDLDSQISDYDDTIDTLTDKMNDAEDRYYSQFSAMETALTKLQNTQSSLSSYLS